MDLEKTLKARHGRYGNFAEQAKLCVSIKNIMRFSLAEDCVGMADREGWKALTPYQQEALDNIALKVSRILSGDPNYTDNWHDIQGYAKLVEDELKAIDNGNTRG